MLENYIGRGTAIIVEAYMYSSRYFHLIRII